MQIKNRAIPGDQQRDPASVEIMQYNERAGARKSIEVGRALLPLGDGAGGFTTNAFSAVRALGFAGRNLAVYNNSGTVGSVTVGDSTVASQAPGAVQISGNNAFVGVPCQPNSWTYLAAGQWNFVAASAATLLVFLIDDPTYIVVQPSNNAST